MANFGDKLRQKSVEKVERRKSDLQLLFESGKNLRETREMLKDYISDDMRERASEAIQAFQEACEAEAKRGKRSINWSGIPKTVGGSKLGSFSVGKFNLAHVLIGAHNDYKDDAEKIKRLIEQELSTMGLCSYRVSYFRNKGRCCFQIQASW